MKKVVITERQKSIIEEALDERAKLPMHLLQGVTSKSTPLSACECIPNDGFLLDLISKRYNEVKSQFSDDITKYDNKQVLSKLSKLTVECIKREKLIKDQLEKICLNTIIDMFKVPENGVELTCSLEETIDSRRTFHITPDTDEDYQYEDYDSIESEESEAQKRMMLNTIIVGGAIRVADIMFKNCLAEIFDLDEELPHLYSQIMKINDYLLFSLNFKIKDNSHKQGGYVEVHLGNDTTPTKIEAHAMIFPILLIEAVRGCMELWASHGLPDDIKTAKAVLNKADALENDPWYTRIGPILWDKLCGKADECKYIPSFIMNLSEIPVSEFNRMLREVIAGTKSGEKMVDDLISGSKYDDDYSDFEYDIKKKQEDKGLITDDYFSNEEIAEWSTMS